MYSFLPFSGDDDYHSTNIKEFHDPVDGDTKKFVLLKPVKPEDRVEKNPRVTWPLKDFDWDGEKDLDQLEPDQIGYYPDPRNNGVSFSILLFLSHMDEFRISTSGKARGYENCYFLCCN